MDNTDMAKNKKKNKNKKEFNLLQAIKNKYFDGKKPSAVHHQHALDFIYNVCLYNANSKTKY